MWKKSKSSPQTQPTAQNRPDHHSSTAHVNKGNVTRAGDFISGSLATLRSLVGLIASASGDAGVPGLSLGLSILIVILEKIQSMRTTIDGVGTLWDRVGTFADSIQHFYSRPHDRKLPDVLHERIENLVKALVTIGERAQDIRSRGPIARFFTSNADAKRLEGLIGEINTSLDDFLVLGILHVEESVHYVRQTVVAINTQLDASFMPYYAKNAQYDASTVRRSCLEGTREEVLDYVDTWVQKCSAEAASSVQGANASSSSRFLWINGLAGTGKTTVACTVAEKYTKRGTLGANFFCSRPDAECSNPNTIFVTISRQLCHYHEPFKVKVVEILGEQPDITTAGPLRQFEELILRPLQRLDGAFPTCVIVLDAIDECQDARATSTILSILARFVKHLASFIFIITSRPEPRIAALFEQSRQDTLKAVTTSLVLHTIELESVTRDIRLYLAHAFAESTIIFELEEGWPSAQDIDALARQSHGLFIWAATAVRFIMDTTFGDPEGRMRDVLAQQAELRIQSTILDSLYNQIAQAASDMVSESPSNRLRLLLGTIAVAQEPLSSEALAGLLGIPVNVVRNSLVGVRSVLHVPQDHYEAIRIIHPTFPEFLLATNMVKPSSFHIDASEHHSTLFFRSLAVMGDLRQDIAGIGDPLVFKTEIPDLTETVKRVISPHVRYVCSHWSAHLCGAAVASLMVEGILQAFKKFLDCHLLHWLEACSLLGALVNAAVALDKACRFCQTTRDPYANFVPLLADYRRFLSTFFSCINTAPLQLYCSALAFAPLRSHVKRNYARDTDTQSVVCHGAHLDWAPCIECISGHGVGYRVYSAAFSPAGDSFATGGQDGTVRVWDSTTRAPLLAVKACDGAVNDVAFSPDGTQIATAQDDSTVCVWQVDSGERFRVLAGHRSGVTSVVYSPSGCDHIVSATKDGEVKLWKSSEERCLTTLPGCNQETWQVAISPDGSVIALGTELALTLYNIYSATFENLPLPSPGRVAMFTPDGQYIAAGTETEIFVWSMAEKSLIYSVTVPATPFRLAFSGNGGQLSCGLRDGSVFLWQIGSADSSRVVQAHTGRIFSVVWSPDESQIITASSDHTLRVWDAAAFLSRPGVDALSRASEPQPPSTVPLPTLLCEGSSINILDLPSIVVNDTLQLRNGSPELTLHPDIAVAWDTAVSHPVRELYMDWCVRARDWELLTGQRCISLCWRPVIISSKGLLMAYVPDTDVAQIHVYSLRTSETVAILSGHTAEVFALAFSPDCTLLATGSNDKTVKIWRVATGELVSSFVGHDHPVRAVAFSSDNRLVVSSARGGRARIHEVFTGRLVHILKSKRPSATVVKVTFSADDKYIVALDHTRHFHVWDAATYHGVYDVSLAGEAWIDSLDFAKDSANIVVRSANGVSHTIALHDLYKRRWPALHVSQDGWVNAKSPGVRARRLCWLPPGWREVFSLGETRFCALDLDRRKAVVFDISL